MYLLILSQLLWASPSPTTILHPAKNSHLREQLQDDRDRVIPQSEHFVFAVDGNAYLRSTGDREFYHGVGYWTQLRTEAQIENKMILNLRSIFYAGSVSYGYANPSGQYHLLGLTGLFEGPFESQAKIRALDLERQTWGQGLLIDEKEMNGLWMQFTRDEMELNMRVNGTGSFYLDDDNYNTEVALLQGKIRGGLIEWVDAKLSVPYLGFNLQGDLFSAQIEGAEYEGHTAGLVKLGAHFDENFWSLKTHLVSRSYSDDFLPLFIRNVQHEYISFDQYDKRYNDPLNIFSYDNNVVASSLDLYWDWLYTDQIKIYLDGEIGIFDFKDIEDRKYGFYRVGVAYLPFVPRQETIQFYFSNKVMDHTGATPPKGRAVSNSPLFFEYAHYGIETNFSF